MNDKLLNDSTAAVYF